MAGLKEKIKSTGGGITHYAGKMGSNSQVVVTGTHMWLHWEKLKYSKVSF